MKKTEHYQLNQWELSDRIMVEDFNADNAKIDAALDAVKAGMPKIVTGTYTGTGSMTDIISIDLGFSPQMVFVCRSSANFTDYSAFFTKECPRIFFDMNIAWITESGFSVRTTYHNDQNRAPYLNAADVIYLYFAIQ